MVDLPLDCSNFVYLFLLVNHQSADALEYGESEPGNVLTFFCLNKKSIILLASFQKEFPTMGNHLLIAVLVASLLGQFHSASAWGKKASSCNHLVDVFEKEHGKHVTFDNIKDAFIFFLHVPRTAGKTYASCFLRPALPPTQRCSPSYDLLRLNISQENCRYIVSHDDYSLTSVRFNCSGPILCISMNARGFFLFSNFSPAYLFIYLFHLQSLPENTVVVTQLRDPVSRVLSAYEFAIEVAARRIKQADQIYFAKAKSFATVSTLNVWPWSYLVPSFRADMRSKVKH